ncbi:ABC transporter permease [Kibdelosporangium lantanae]|uniref:ABC transporter permease n=1 Tax=Kibdelosporangium lantanae TaxID=1497396 RepID=A0ABW3M3E2_9PSEU
MIFGLTPLLLVAMIAFGALWPILVTSMHGANRLDPLLIDTVRAFRITRPLWIVGVVLPAAAPWIFTGLRQSLSVACILMVVAEMIGSSRGIGAQLAAAQTRFDMVQMWQWLVLLAVVGAAFNGLLMAAERRILVWQQADTTGSEHHNVAR